MLCKFYCVPESCLVGSGFNVQKALQSGANICNFAGFDTHFFLKIYGSKSVNALKKLAAENL